MPFTFSSRQDDLEGRDDLFAGSAPAHVEEIGGLAAEMLDDVHRAHGQAGTVDQAGDVSVEGDVVQVELRGLDFLGVLFVQVPEGDDLRVAEKGVVVEGHLGVEGQNLIVRGGNQGIDLDHGGVGFPEHAVEVADQAGGVLAFLLVESKFEDDLAQLEIGQADRPGR